MIDPTLYDLFSAETPEVDQDSKHSALNRRVLMTFHPNVLVAGDADAVERSLADLMAYLDVPVCYWTAAMVFPSTPGMKTLVIRNVDGLSAQQQRDLSSWLEHAAIARIQVVSTTTVPLYQHVAAGLFLGVLYYRLNVWMWERAGEQCLS